MPLLTSQNCEELMHFQIERKAGTGKVNFDRQYYVHDDPTMNPIDKEDKIRGFRYGKQLVHTCVDLQTLNHSIRCQSTKR